MVNFICVREDLTENEAILCRDSITRVIEKYDIASCINCCIAPNKNTGLWILYLIDDNNNDRIKNKKSNKGKYFDLIYDRINTAIGDEKLRK